MNWPFIILSSIVTLALVILHVMRNQNDEKDLGDQLYDEFLKPSIDEIDIDKDKVRK